MTRRRLNGIRKGLALELALALHALRRLARRLGFGVHRGTV